jgi:hypothetical protein
LPQPFSRGQALFGIILFVLNSLRFCMQQGECIAHLLGQDLLGAFVPRDTVIHTAGSHSSTSLAVPTSRRFLRSSDKAGTGMFLSMVRVGKLVFL